MVQYKIVADYTDRVPVYPTKMIQIPRLTKAKLGDDEYYTWELQNSWANDFNVWPEDRSYAKRLAEELYYRWQIVDDVSDSEIVRIVAELKKMRVNDDLQRSALEQWEWYSRQLIDYSGSTALSVHITSRLSQYQGDILEAFCGHNSYFGVSKERTITALDYCEGSLRRYVHSDAKRICCDLNQVEQVGDLSFLDDRSFDVISICFGYKYPHDVVLLMSEFKRILRLGGVLSFVESEMHEFPRLKQRKFNEYLIQNDLNAAGFSKIEVDPICGVSGDSRLNESELVWHVIASR